MAALVPFEVARLVQVSSPILTSLKECVEVTFKLLLIVSATIVLAGLPDICSSAPVGWAVLPPALVILHAGEGLPPQPVKLEKSPEPVKFRVVALTGEYNKIASKLAEAISINFFTSIPHSRLI